MSIGKIVFQLLSEGRAGRSQVIDGECLANDIRSSIVNVRT